MIFMDGQTSCGEKMKFSIYQQEVEEGSSSIFGTCGTFYDVFKHNILIMIGSQSYDDYQEEYSNDRVTVNSNYNDTDKSFL